MLLLRVQEAITFAQHPHFPPCLHLIPSHAVSTAQTDNPPKGQGDATHTMIGMYAIAVLDPPR
ncbi:hypothetical protein M3J09_010855 [Ascochyta lentis]